MLAVLLTGFLVQQETYYGTYYTLQNSSAKVDVKACEKFVISLEREWGVQMPHYHYYRLEDPVQLELFTGEMVEGLAYVSRNTIYSTHAFHRHELVHLVLGQLGEPETAFAEGVAMMLGNDIPELNREYARDRLRQKRVTYAQFIAMFAMRVDEEKLPVPLSYAYCAADAWMRSLRARHGIGKIRAFFQDSHAAADTDTAFTAAFGRPPEESFNRWLYGRTSPSPK